MKLMRNSIILMMMFVAIAGFSQTPLRIQIQVNKPYPNKITDFQSYPEQVVIMITNTSQSSYQVQLLTAISGDNNISIRTTNNFRSSRPVEVAPLTVTKLTAQDIAELLNPNGLVFSGLSREEATRMNGLPEGLYQVCVRAVDYITRLPLSEDEPLGCSNLFNISNLEPPVVIKPFAEEILNPQPVQNIVLNWSMPPGAPPSTQYNIRLVEMPDAQRNPFDVMRSSRQPYFETVVTGAPTFLYGPAEPPLVRGRKYALMITAIDPFGNLVFRNGGRSEVIAFTYGDTQSTTTASVISTQKLSAVNIPRSVVTGKINWYFKLPEEKGTAIASPVKLSSIVEASLARAMHDPTAGAELNVVMTSAFNSGKVTIPMISPTSKPSKAIIQAPRDLIKNSLAPAVVVSGAGTVTSVSSPVMTNDGVMQEFSKDIVALGTLPNPLIRTKIKVYAVSNTGVSTLVSSTETNDEGLFEAAFVNTIFYNPSLGNKVRVTIEHPDFILQKAELNLPKPDSTGRFDLGTLSALARTFRFKPVVLGEDGQELKEAIVEIYRNASFYETEANARKEGTITSEKTEVVNGNNSYKVASIATGRTSGKLFYSDHWMDQYIIRVVEKNSLPLTTTFQVSADGAAREEIITIEKTFTLQTRMPTFSGQVFKKLEPLVNVGGATVTLHINKDAVSGTKSNHGVEELGKKALIDIGKIFSATNPSPTAPTSGGAKPSTKITSGYILPAMATESKVGKLATSLTAAENLSNSRSTTTDSAGNFFFADVPISSNYTRISVRIPGSDKVYYDSVLINVKATDYKQDLPLSMTIFTLGGIVKDEEGVSIPNPVLRWTSGGTPFEGDDQGRFVATNTAGKDTLIIMKVGYDVKRIPVALTEPPASKVKQKSSSTGASKETSWTSLLQDLPSFKLVAAEPLSAKGFGYLSKATPTNKIDLSPLFSALVPEDAAPAAPTDLGTITLQKKTARILVKVLNTSDKKPIAGCQVNVIDSPISGVTNGSGAWYSQIPGGDITLEIKGPPSSSFFTIQRQILTEDSDTTRVEIFLKAGVKVTGTVKAGSEVVTGANVRVEGLEYLKTETDGAGKYLLIIPEGDYTLKATKSGFVGSEKQLIFKMPSATIDFNFTSAGFDISKLLGFDVEIEKIENTGSTKTLSGAFVNLPSNPLFKIKPGSRLPFEKLQVTVTDGIPVPQDGQVKLAVTSFDMNVFDFLPVSIRNADAQLTVRQLGTNPKAGQLVGVPEINYSKFIPMPQGFTFPESLKHNLSTGSTTGPIPVIQSGDAMDIVEGLSINTTAEAKVDLYGFGLTLDLPNCSVKKDGLYLAGMLGLEGIPLLGSSKFKVEQFVIGTDATIKKVNVTLGVEKSIKIATWQATLQSISLNENGFKFSGDVKIQVPQSAETQMLFSNLAIAKTALYGGSFSLPKTGLDIFGIVKMQQSLKPLSFGRVGNSNVYFLGGSGEFKFPTLIDKTFTIEFFQVQTDGNFAATVPANFGVNLLNVVKIDVRSLTFKTIGGAGIDIKGDFNLSGIPFFKASAGGIHYLPGGAVSVDEIGLGFELVGVAKIDAKAHFVNESDKKGFEGAGSIKIKSTPLDLGLGFRYFRLDGGYEVGALIRTGITVPIGAVTLADIEGEFNLNTKDNKWMGRLGGSLSIGGLNAAVAVKPLTITVENGPVFKLDGGLTVLEQNIAKAHGLLDFPKSYFAFGFETNLNFLPQLYTVDGSGMMVLSTAKSDTYWMLGAQFQASMLGGLVKGTANVTSGWGLNVDAHPELSEYTTFINRDYLDGTVLKGIHVATFAGIKFDTGERGFEGVATGRAWYNNYGAVNMDMGFGRGRYGFRVAAGWEAGAYLKISDVNVAGVDAGIEGELKGFYDYGAGYLSFEGALRARLIAWIGSCTSACENKVCWGGCFDPCPVIDCEVCPIPVGGKICVRPGVHAAYNTGEGFNMSIDF